MAKRDGRIGFTGKEIKNPLKAIRQNCLDCVCGSEKEVRLCPSTVCPLYPFRFGYNPYYSKVLNSQNDASEEDFSDEDDEGV